MLVMGGSHVEVSGREQAFHCPRSLLRTLKTISHSAVVPIGSDGNGKWFCSCEEFENQRLRGVYVVA